MFLAGGVAIGSHSYALLGPSLPFLPFISSSSSGSNRSHSHSHSHEYSLDPNAAWFALLSIITKEILYRMTAAVAKTENSPVLLANALHHRSDMYSSLVSLVAILASWSLPALPLDPIGGKMVAIRQLQLINCRLRCIGGPPYPSPRRLDPPWLFQGAHRRERPGRAPTYPRSFSSAIPHSDGTGCRESDSTTQHSRHSARIACLCQSRG
jgi:hypothetical protein